VQQLKLSAVSSAIDLDPRAAVVRARQLGLSGLLFDAYSAALSMPELTQSGRREFRHLLSSNDLALVGLRVDVGAKGFGPGADVDRLLHRLDRAMETAAGLAAPLMCVDLGPLREPPRTGKPRAAISAEQAGLLILPAMSEPEPAPAPAAPSTAELALEQQVNSALMELAVRADRYSVTVAMSSSLASFAALQNALAAARCAWFGIELDPVAILRDEWSVDDIFSALGPLIRHVRVRDAIGGADRRTRPAVVGQGSSDWPALLARLDETGYQSWMTIDPTELTDRIGAIRAAVRHLTKALP
jgi:sugar phosphate isomerase/epimerase